MPENCVILAARRQPNAARRCSNRRNLPNAAAIAGAGASSGASLPVLNTPPLPSGWQAQAGAGIGRRRLPKRVDAGAGQPARPVGNAAVAAGVGVGAGAGAGAGHPAPAPACVRVLQWAGVGKLARRLVGWVRRGCLPAVMRRRCRCRCRCRCRSAAHHPHPTRSSQAIYGQPQPQSAAAAVAAAACAAVGNAL